MNEKLRNLCFKLFFLERAINQIGGTKDGHCDQGVTR